MRAAKFLRDLVARDVVRMRHLPGKVMVADLLNHIGSDNPEPDDIQDTAVRPV